MPVFPACEAMVMIRPEPWPAIRRAASRATRNAPVAMTSTLTCQSRRLSSVIGVSPIARPAQFTTTSTRPCSRRALSNSASTCSSEVTSQGTASTGPSSASSDAAWRRWSTGATS